MNNICIGLEYKIDCKIFLNICIIICKCFFFKCLDFGWVWSNLIKVVNVY